MVYVVSHGWHAELGIPVAELGPDLAFARALFPGARVLMFGYGKKTFITAPPDTISEYFLGPFPGPAVIQIVGLNVTPDDAYDAGDTVRLALPPGGSAALSHFIGQDIAKDKTDEPVLVSHSSDPAGLFYAAQSHYNLLHTCNSWTADALHAAGLPISGDGVIFSSQIMARAEAAAGNQCLP